MIRVVETKPFFDQKMGTSGLRKKVKVFQQEHYVENFIQSIFNSLTNSEKENLVVGGDGRYFNYEVLNKIFSIAAANGCKKIIVGMHGILSTPAASCLIRKYKASGGIILSASHNPAGPEGDFGIKYNIKNGGPAPEQVTNSIWEATKIIDFYKISDQEKIKIGQKSVSLIENTIVEVVDSVQDYADLMETLFDFVPIRSLFQKGFRMIFDSMHAVTGPYAQEIFEHRLGAPKGTVHNHLILQDFGGKNPDPNPIYAKHLYHVMMSKDSPDFGAASDGDGDRNMIMGRGIFVSPSDSLAILTAHAHLISGWKEGIRGVARSMPTSQAVDIVAKEKGIPLYETPTGWKFFGNLLDAKKIFICGEESFGTGGNHIAEKDGIWAVLFWLHILAVRQKSVQEIVEEHWKIYGRHYYTRHDYEDVEEEKIQNFVQNLNLLLPSLSGRTVQGLRISSADHFMYQDPVDGCVHENQGIRIIFSQGERIIFRISGTGTTGFTLRMYIEKYEKNTLTYQEDVQEILANLILAAEEIANISSYLGRKKPTLLI